MKTSMGLRSSGAESALCRANVPIGLMTPPPYAKEPSDVLQSSWGATTTPRGTFRPTWSDSTFDDGLQRVDRLPALVVPRAFDAPLTHSPCRQEKEVEDEDSGE